VWILHILVVQRFGSLHPDQAGSRTKSTRSPPRA
jgi:hypothetical protein